MEEQIKYTRCKKCNRPLKDKKSQDRGYGEHCWSLYNKERIKKQRTLFDALAIITK